MKMTILYILLAAAALALVLYLPIPAVVRGAVALLSPLELGLAAALPLSVPARALEGPLSLLLRREPGGRAVRVVSSAVTVACFAASACAVCFLLRPALISSVRELSALVSERLPALIAALGVDSVDPGLLSGLITGGVDMNAVLGSLAGTPGMGILANTLMSAAVSFISAVAVVSLALVIALYALIERRRLAGASARALRAAPPRVSKAAGGLCRAYYRSLARLLSHGIPRSALFALALYLGLWASGFPYAALLAVLAGFLDLVPIFGPACAAALSVCLALLVSPGRAALWICVFAALKLAELLLSRRMNGGKYAPPPLGALAAFLIGLRLLGPLGPVFFIPIVPALRELVSRRAGQEKGE